MRDAATVACSLHRAEFSMHSRTDPSARALRNRRIRRMPHRNTNGADTNGADTNGARRRAGTSHGDAREQAGESGKEYPAHALPATCERDDTYGLISVVYHALQGAETCAQYVEDARRSRNAALEAFFEEARVAQNDLAFKGKHLLAAQLEAALDEDIAYEVDDVSHSSEDES
jgi:hypothetical protein